MKLKVTILGAVLASAFLSDYAYAAASRGHVTSQADRVIRRVDKAEDSINNRIDRARDSIVNTLNRNHSDLLNNLRKIAQDSTQAQTAQVTKAAEAQSKAAIDLQKAKDKRQKEDSITEIECGNSGAANAPKGGGGMTTRKTGGSGSSWQPKGLSDETTAALNNSGQTSTPSKPPIDRDAQRRLLSIGACKDFAAPGTERAMICEQMGLSSAGALSDTLPNGDIDATVLFDGNNQDGRKLLSVPVDGENKNRNAINAYIAKTTYPVPFRSLPDGIYKLPEGQAYAGELDNFRARLSMGEAPIRDYDAFRSSPAKDDEETRSANASSISIMKEDENTSSFIDDYLSNAGPDGSALSPEDISPLEMMNIEVERRISNPDWHKAMAGATSEEKASEQLFIDAYMSRIQFMQLVEQKKTNVLLGQLIVLQNELNSRDRLDEQAAFLHQRRALIESSEGANSSKGQ